MSLRANRRPRQSLGAPPVLNGDRPLIGIAASLFRRKGYRATTTREMAKELGIQGASLYHYIRSKEDLLYAICLNALDDIQREVSRAIEAETDHAARLAALIAAHLRAAMADRDEHATMLFELRSLGPARYRDVVRRRDAYEQLVRSVIQDGQDAGVLRTDLAAKHLTLALLNLLNWSIFWFKPGGALSVAQLSALLSAVFLEGVLRKPAAGARQRRRLHTRARRAGPPLRLEESTSR